MKNSQECDVKQQKDKSQTQIIARIYINKKRNKKNHTQKFKLIQHKMTDFSLIKFNKICFQL